MNIKHFVIKSGSSPSKSGPPRHKPQNPSFLKKKNIYIRFEKVGLQYFPFNNTTKNKTIEYKLIPFHSCNSNAKPPATIKILLIGNDWLQGTVLRHYVDLLGVRPPDWVSHLRFYEVPIGICTMSKYLASIDQSYQAMFGTENWYQLCERAAACINSMDNKSDVVEMCNRIQRYLHTAGPCTQIPIAEAMVNYKDEESCQIFVPFVSVS